MWKTSLLNTLTQSHSHTQDTTQIRLRLNWTTADDRRADFLANEVWKEREREGKSPLPDHHRSTGRPAVSGPKEQQQQQQNNNKIPKKKQG